MKIIGGNDYYDRAMSYGVDTTSVLVRNSVKIEDAPFHCNYPTSLSHTTHLHQFRVIVGDTRYIGYLVSRVGSYGVRKSERLFAYSEESLDRALEEFGVSVPSYAQKAVSSTVYSSKISEKQTNWMIEKGLSILLVNFYCHKLAYVGNPSTLRDFEFYRALDPFTMYQTLDMWVSGVLSGRGNKTVEITDDKIKIQKHGFDLKQSFRHRKKA